MLAEVFLYASCLLHDLETITANFLLEDSDASSISILIGNSSKKRRKSWFRNNNKVANDQGENKLLKI